MEEIIEYYKNGETVKKLEFYKNGKKHRIDGPASIWYNESGEIRTETYYINNKLHRLDGPAEIRYYESGEIYGGWYYINGIRFNNIDDWKKEANIIRNLKLLNKK